MRIGTFIYDRIRLIALVGVILLAAYMQFGIKTSGLFTQVVIFATASYLLHEYWINYSFYKGLSESLSRDEGVATPWTGEQELFCDTIDRLSEDHREKYAKLKQKKIDHEVFIDLIVHEMKTPLTTMQIMAQDFNEKNTDKLRREIKRLDNQLTTALYYSRQDDLKNDYKLISVNMRAFIHSLLDENSDDLINSDISVSTQNLDEVLLTDPKWLSYVVGQILRNAFSGQGYGITSLQISLECQGKWCDLIIKDNGIGIPEHELQRIFHKAYAGEGRRSSKSSSGLGLYLSAQIAERLGLELSVESIEGQGTSFKIERLRRKMKDH